MKTHPRIYLAWLSIQQYDGDKENRDMEGIIGRIA